MAWHRKSYGFFTISTATILSYESWSLQILLEFAASVYLADAWPQLSSDEAVPAPGSTAPVSLPCRNTVGALCVTKMPISGALPDTSHTAPPSPPEQEFISAGFYHELGGPGGKQWEKGAEEERGKQEELKNSEVGLERKYFVGTEMTEPDSWSHPGFSFTHQLAAPTTCFLFHPFH